MSVSWIRNENHTCRRRRSIWSARDCSRERKTCIRPCTTLWWYISIFTRQYFNPQNPWNVRHVVSSSTRIPQNVLRCAFVANLWKVLNVRIFPLWNFHSWCSDKQHWTLPIVQHFSWNKWKWEIARNCYFQNLRTYLVSVVDFLIILFYLVYVVFVCISPYYRRTSRNTSFEH